MGEHRVDVDYVRDIGMPETFTVYTYCLACVLSSGWALSAMPAMLPAFVAPPASGGVSALLSPSEGRGDNVTLASLFYTVIEEFSLDAHLAEWTTTAYFIGSLTIGQLPCAYSDKLGRKPILVGCSLLTGVASLFSAYAPCFSFFLVGRFLQGAAFTAATNVSWVMMCESISFACHANASILFGIMWVVGYCVIAPLAALFPTWRMLFLFTGLLNCVYAIVVHLTVRESLAFLIHRRRRKEVEAWVSHMEAFNQTKYDGSCLDELLADGRSVDSQETLASESRIFCRRGDCGAPQEESMWMMTKRALADQKITIWLFISIYMWITDFLVYNGLSMTSTGIKVFNPYWNYVISGIVELPATFALPMLMDWIGRRPTVILSHIETALALFCMCFISIENELLYLVVWMLAKFGTASSFIALYIYGSEIFPIQYRNLCLGICCTLGNLGAIAAPYTAQLGLTMPWLVFSLYGAVSLVSAVLDVWLPETMHRKNGGGDKQSPPVLRRRRSISCE